ncbi:hypothetical protein GIB67_040619 [Kingdonia uniflora]|uniref:ARM repeat superfamily protein n=1 Tax=Kingdonia uniflora TaxID=39325 RepID=A0A7J7M8Z5_9MAGN|nr:hypothetical protein GIB67_040619 [Kingdonia uniflora]
MHSDMYGERRGAAFGLAGLVKGFGISCLKKYGIVAVLQQGLEDRNSAKSREGSLLGFECLCEKLGRLFEPYVIQMLPVLLVSLSDQVIAVHEAAECASRAMMSQLSGHRDKLILPSLLKVLEDKAWQTKQSSMQLFGAMAYCAPQQLSQCLPRIVLKLTEVLTDTHPKVQSAGQMTLQQVGSVIKNPEISSLIHILLKALTDPNEYIKHSLDILLQTTFVNSIEAPSLALLVPIVHRGLRERSSDTKKKAAQIAGNMCSTVRSTSALALRKLSALSTRVDPLVGDLLSTLQASDGGVREAILTVQKHAGKSVSISIRSRVFVLLKELINLDDDPSSMFFCKDDSSEARRRALSVLKAVAKENHSAIAAYPHSLGPALADCLKHGNTPVRLAAERCALHVFQLIKGSDNVQAAQKSITGLDARRVSKFPENSDESENSDDETPNGL